jgi:hypothetical protein
VTSRERRSESKWRGLLIECNTFLTLLPILLTPPPNTPPPKYSSTQILLKGNKLRLDKKLENFAMDFLLLRQEFKACLREEGGGRGARRA